MYIASWLSSDGLDRAYILINGSTLFILLKCYKNLFYFYDKAGSIDFVTIFCPLNKCYFPYEVNVVYYLLLIKEVFYSVKILFLYNFYYPNQINPQLNFYTKLQNWKVSH
jgi:hypothetical protein